MRAPSSVRLAGLVLAVMCAFAGNSLLCRAALEPGTTDPTTFTLVRLACGAAVLQVLARRSPAPADRKGDAARALALFAYAALFSWAYARIPAGVGAFVLFACVQLTMVGWAVREGRGPHRLGWVGILVALGGLAYLALPGASPPDVLGVGLMAGSGAAWGVYTLLGRGGQAPLARTATSFLGAAPVALAAFAVATALGVVRIDARGIGLAAASGAVTSGLGYVLWYSVLPHLDAARAAVVQLLVPPLAAVGAIVLLGEPPSPRLGTAGAAILGGIALTLRPRATPGVSA